MGTLFFSIFADIEQDVTVNRKKIDTQKQLHGCVGDLGYGAAAAILFPEGDTWVLCQSLPFPSSEGAEFWSALMFLR